MNGKTLQTLALYVIGGLVVFNVLMGVAMFLTFYNARTAPTIPWYPIPVIILIVVSTWWLKGHWNIRLTLPANVPWARIYAFSFLAMLAAKCIKVIEGSFHGSVMAAPLPPEGVSAGFGLAYLFMLPFFAAVLAEIYFRGIMQTKFEELLPLWPTILILAAINTLSHVGFTDISTQWIYLMAMNVGFGLTAWMAQSIVPAIVMHVVMNVIFPGSQYLWGPFELGELGATGVITIAIIGIVAGTTAFWLARGVPTPIIGRQAPA